MKKLNFLYSTLIIMSLFVSLANISFATDYVTISNGDASNGANWQGGVAPKSFGGTGDNETTITINHNVYYKGDYAVPGALTINANCVLVTQKFEVKNGKSLVLNGVLICYEVFQDASGDVTGSGTIIAGKFTGNTPPAGITTVTGVYIWTGATSSNWETATNWYDGNVPNVGSFVAIGPFPDYQPVIDNLAVSLGTIYIAISQSITINPNASLTVNIANLYSKGILNIKSDANGTGSLLLSNIPVLSSEAELNVQRYLPSPAKWHIISSPVVGQTMGGFATTNSLRTNAGNYALAPYNVLADNWSPFTPAGNTTQFVKGQGYMVSSQAAGTITFTGTSINTGNVSYSLETTGYRWNSIGNPYTTSVLAKGAGSFLDVNAGAIDPAYLGLYVWDYSLGTAGDYKVISNGGFTFPGPGGVTELNLTNIAVGQGFVVKAKDTGGTISFTPAMQQLANNAPFKSVEKSVPALRLTVKSGTLENNTIVAFENESTLGLDPGYDVGKFMGNANIALYTKLVGGVSDVDFAIQSLPNTTFELRVIPVGFDLKSGGVTTFSLETVSFPENAKVYLDDKVLNTRTLLNKDGAEYKVTLPETKGYGRFNLLVADFSNSNVTTNITLVEKPDFNIYTHNNAIFVNGNIERGALVALYGIDGKMRYSGKAESSGLYRIDTSGFPAGIYLLKINQNGGQFTQKVVLTGI